MDIKHRIGFNTAIDPELLPILKELRIKHKRINFPGKRGVVVYFDIWESNPYWKEIEPYTEGISDICQTYFSEDEILEADWVRLIPVFTKGYPQPEDTWVSEPHNYVDSCATCGSYQQASSFRIQNEPDLGKHDFLTLHWAYVLFCTHNVVNTLAQQKISGYEVWDVLVDKTDSTSKKISQLYIPQIAGPGLTRVDDLDRYACPECNIAKYRSHMKGIMYMRREALKGVNVDMVQTYEWFGSGHAAYREILISNQLARLVIAKKWRGIHLKVVELAD